MAQIRKLCEKIILIIVMMSILVTYCATPASYAKLELEDGEFYYSGTTEGSYVATEGIFSWLINALGQVADFIVGLLTYVIRMVFVGWTAIFETLLTNTIEKTSGVNMEGAVLGTDEDGQVNNSDITQINSKNARVTVQAIVYNQVAAFDIDFFDLKVDRRYSGTGSRLYCEKNKEFCDVLFGVDIDSEDYDPTKQLSDVDKCNCPNCTAFKDHYKNTNDDGSERKTMVEVLREKTAGWFYTIRILAAVALLLVLIFLGIKIAYSSIASEKAVYKRMLVDWLVGVIIVFTIPYIMYFIIFLNKTMVNIMREATNGMTKVAVQQLNEKSKKDNSGSSIYLSDQQIEQSIYDVVKTRAYDPKLIVGSAGMLMYMALVYFAFRYTLIYLKRYFTVMILTIMAPALGASYAFQKVLSGKAPSFKNWFSEYFMNVMIQTIHALIYGVFIATSLILSIQSLSGTIVAFIMMNYSLKAEKTFRKIFKFGSSNALADSTVEAGDPNQIDKNIKGAMGMAAGAGALAEGFTHTPAAVAVKTAAKIGGSGIAAGIGAYQKHKRSKSGDGDDGAPEDGVPPEDNVGHAEGQAGNEGQHDIGNTGAEMSKVEGAVAQTQRPTIEQVLSMGTDGTNRVLQQAMHDYSLDPSPENEQKVLNAAQDAGMVNAFNNVPTNLAVESKVQRIVDVTNDISYSYAKQPTSMGQALYGLKPSDLGRDRNPNILSRAIGGGILGAQATYAKLFGTKRYNPQTGKYDTVKEGYYTTLAPLMAEYIPKGVVSTALTGGLNYAALYATLGKEERDMIKKDVLKPIMAGFGGIASTFIGLGTFVASPTVGMTMLASGVPNATRMLIRNPSTKKYNGTYTFSKYGTGTVQHLAEEALARSRKEWDSQVVTNLMQKHPELARSLSLSEDGSSLLYGMENLKDFDTSKLTNAQLKQITSRKGGLNGATFRNRLGNAVRYTGMHGAAISTQRRLYTRKPSRIGGAMGAAFAATGIASFGEQFDLDYAKLVKKKQTQFLMDAIRLEGSAAEVTTKLDSEDMIERVYNDEAERAKKHAQDARIAVEARRRGFVYDEKTGTFRLMTKEELEQARKEFGLGGVQQVSQEELIKSITDAISLDLGKIDLSKVKDGMIPDSIVDKKGFLAGKAEGVITTSVSQAVIKLVQEGKLEAITGDKQFTQEQVDMIMVEAGKIAKDQLQELGIQLKMSKNKKTGAIEVDSMFMASLFGQSDEQKQAMIETLTGVVRNACVTESVNIDLTRIDPTKVKDGIIPTSTADKKLFLAGKAKEVISASMSQAVLKLVQEGKIEATNGNKQFTQEQMEMIMREAGAIAKDQLQELGIQLDTIKNTKTGKTEIDPMFMASLFGQSEDQKKAVLEKLSGVVSEIDDSRIFNAGKRKGQVSSKDRERSRKKANAIINDALNVAVNQLIQDGVITEESIKSGEPLPQELMDQIIEKAGEISRGQLGTAGVKTTPTDGVDDKHFLYCFLEQDKDKLGQSLLGAVTESVTQVGQKTTAIQALVAPAVSSWEKERDRRLTGHLPSVDEVVSGKAHTEFVELAERGITEHKIDIPSGVTGIDRVDFVERRRKEAAEIMNQALLTAMFTMIEEGQLTEKTMGAIKDSGPRGGRKKLDDIVERAGDIAREKLEEIGISTEAGAGLDDSLYLYELLDAGGSKKKGERIGNETKAKVASVLDAAYEYTKGHQEDIQDLRAMTEGFEKTYELEAEGIIESVIASTSDESGKPVTVSEESREAFAEFIKQAMIMTHEDTEEKTKAGFIRDGEEHDGKMVIDVARVGVETVKNGMSAENRARIEGMTDVERGMLEEFVTTVARRENDETVDRFEFRKEETTRKVKKLKELMDLYDGTEIVSSAVENPDGTVTLTENAPEKTKYGTTIVVEEDGKPTTKVTKETIVISKEVLESIPRVQKNILQAEGINEFASRSTMKEETNLKKAKAQEQDDKIELLKKKKEAAEIQGTMDELEYALRRLEIERASTTDAAKLANLEREIGEKQTSLKSNSRSLQMVAGDIVIHETAAAISGRATSQAGPAVHVNERYTKDIGSVISSLERLGNRGNKSAKTTTVTGGTEWVSSGEVKDVAKAEKDAKKKKSGSRLDDVLNVTNTGANINDVIDGSRKYGEGRSTGTQGSKDGNADLSALLSGMRSSGNSGTGASTGGTGQPGGTNGGPQGGKPQSKKPNNP